MQQELETSNNGAILQGKYKPCACHECVEVNCYVCKIKIFQEPEQIKVFNENVERAYHLCPKCCDVLRKISPKNKIVEVEIALDRPEGSIQ